MDNTQLSEAYSKIKTEAKSFYPFSFLNELIYNRKNFQAKLSVERYQSWSDFNAGLVRSRDYDKFLGLDMTADQAGQLALGAAAIATFGAGVTAMAGASIGAAAAPVGASTGGILSGSGLALPSLTTTELSAAILPALQAEAKKQLDQFTQPKTEIKAEEPAPPIYLDQFSKQFSEIPAAFKLAGVGALALLFFI